MTSVYPSARVSITDRIRSDVAAAMRAGERDRVGTLRLVLSELQKDAKEGPGDEVAVLRRERKRRRDAQEAFAAAGREELVAVEAAEEAIIAGYPDEDLDALVREAIERTGATGPRDVGRVIKEVLAAASGRADGRRVSARVKEAL
jgi:uncharacterized protein